MAQHHVTDQQRKQLQTILKLVGRTTLGEHLRLNEIKPNQSIDALHLALLQRTEVMPYHDFANFVARLVPTEKPSTPEALFTIPQLLTDDKVVALARRQRLDGALPLTQWQMRYLYTQQLALQKSLGRQMGLKKLKQVHPFVLYRDPLLTYVNGLPCSSLDTLIAAGFARGMWQEHLAVQPPVTAIQAAGKSRLQQIMAFAETLKQAGAGINMLHARPSHLTDLTFELARQAGRLVRMAEICPELKLYIYDSGVMGPYRKDIEFFLQGLQIPMLARLLSATGVAGYADQLQHPNQVRLDAEAGIFFEFIPLDDLDANGRFKRDFRRLHVGRLELGSEYILVVTSRAGLIAFNTELVVKICSLEPLRVEVKRTTAMLNTLGERLSTDLIDPLIEEFNDATAKGYGFFIREYMVADQADNRQALWVMELSRPLGEVKAAVLKSFTNRLHAELSRSSKSYYRAFQGQGSFQPLMTFVPLGTFAAMPGSFCPTHLDLSPDARRVRQLIQRAGSDKLSIRATAV